MLDLKLKRPGPTFYHILIFIVTQLTWFLLLGLWIYWYVSNYLLLDKMEGMLLQEVFPDNLNIIALVSGLILLVVLSVGMSLIFIHLNKQLNVTRLYDNFISNMTHELKSPLSSIQMYAETLLQRNVSLKHQKEFLQMMLQDTERLGNLINSILYLSSLENQKMVKTVHSDYNIYNADSLFQNIFSELQKEFKMEDKSLHIEGELDCDCVADRTWLKIVISNLFDNAMKYSVEKPRIQVLLNKDNTNFFISIKDNGIGIQPRDQKKVFNKFQRLSNPDNPNVKGTGLGLYWVKEIVKHHRGKISLESNEKNQGSTFKITLPIYKGSRQRYINRLLKRSYKQQKSGASHEKN